MTRVLSILLGAQEPSFRLNINALEQINGHENHDIRLSSEIYRKVASKILELGLDPNDTTPEELYMSLRRKLESDESDYLKFLELDRNAPTQIILSRTLKLVKNLNFAKNCFALKNSVAKKLLKDFPPKKLMKHLGYRSVDSMLKHEPIPQIIVASLLYESSHWKHLFYEQYKQLHPNNFELRQISFYFPQNNSWGAIANDFVEKYKNTTIVLPEFGAIILVPVANQINNIAITHTLILLECVNSIRTTSAYLKLNQVRSDFGKIVSQTALGNEANVANIVGQPIGWRTIHTFFDNYIAQDLPGIFEPHVQKEDLGLVDPEKLLAKTVPSLSFWIDTNSLAMVKNSQIVSLNMLDVALNSTNNLPLADSILKFVRQNVTENLLHRYFDYPTIENLVNQLGQGLYSTDKELALEQEVLKA